MSSSPISAGRPATLSELYDYVESPAARGEKARLAEVYAAHGQWEAPSPMRAGNWASITHRNCGIPPPADSFDAAVVKYLDARPTRGSLGPAVAEAFLGAVDERGLIDPERIHSEHAAALFREFQAAIAQHPSPAPLYAEKYVRASPEAAKLMARGERLSSHAERMPALQRVSRAVGGAHALENVPVLALQHLFPTTLALFDELQANGADVYGKFGKIYSTDGRVYGRLHHLRGAVGDESFLSGLAGEDESALRLKNGARARLDALFEPYLDGRKPLPERFVLIDEGGYLTEALHDEPRFLEFAERCVVVEQTQSGGNKIDALQREGRLACNVVAVWRSELKKVFESPSIGESIVVHAMGCLQDLQVKLPAAETKVGFVGAGAVNVEVMRSLISRGYRAENFHVVDPNPASLEQARARFPGITVGALEEVLPQSDLVFTATGKRAILPDQWQYFKPGAVVFNGGSGNYEASSDTENFEAARRTAERMTRREHGGSPFFFQGRAVKFGTGPLPHRFIRLTGGGEVAFARSGYVVNMQEDLPPEIAQVTRAMMLAGALQGAKLSLADDGFGGQVVELDPALQAIIHETALESLAPYGATLEAPDFSKFPAYA